MSDDVNPDSKLGMNIKSLTNIEEAMAVMRKATSRIGEETEILIEALVALWSDGSEGFQPTIATLEAAKVHLDNLDKSLLYCQLEATNAMLCLKKAGK